MQTALLTQLSKLYPTLDHALARIAVLSARLRLPKPTVHVISDIHGEYSKLRHIINNGSGSLPILVKELLGARLSSDQILRLLSFIYYPGEAYKKTKAESNSTEEFALDIRLTLRLIFEIISHLAERYSFEHLLERIPSTYTHVFRELIIGPRFGRSIEYLNSLLQKIIDHQRDLEFLRLSARLVRNMLIGEIIVAGDFGDRGPRIDKCIDFISRQPNVSVTWGNHDVAWMGACLGHPALIASVVRISLRYGRLKQLEEGYGVSLAPLESLARSAYGTDSAQFFTTSQSSEREPHLLARMQKAIATIQFKLEAQVIRRNPHFAMENRDLIAKVSPARDSITIGGIVYPLRDTNFPTLNGGEAIKLTSEEETTIQALQSSFTSSQMMWKHMQYLAEVGSMYLVRDQTLIFHGCVPVSGSGEFLDFQIYGQAYQGRSLFDRLNFITQRAFQFQRSEDLDLLWYLWCGPRSPLFGKDRITTFESYFIADNTLHIETKNPYFSLIHEVDFCRKIMHEFGVNSTDGLIVNGHVPVKIEQGESPVKLSNLAVTIDGAFSEAYGDKGYTLVLESEGSYLAQHGHFDSVDSSLESGADMIPAIIPLRNSVVPRLVRDTEDGEKLSQEIDLLEKLVQAYRENILRPDNH